MHSEFPCDRAECSVLPQTGVGPDRHAPSRYARDGFRYVYLLADGARTSVTTGWQQLQLATALHQAGSPPTSGSFDVLLRARDREGAILRG